MIRKLSLFIFTVSLLYSSTSFAGFLVKNTEICLINQQKFSDLTESVRLSGVEAGVQRACNCLIRFVDQGTLEMNASIEIKGEPRCDVNGNLYGPMISIPSNNSFTFDAQGVGDCPLKIKTNNKVDLARVTIKADNINKAVCDLAGNALYDSITNGKPNQTDTQEQTVYIHPDVTIVPAQPPADQDLDDIPDNLDNCPETPNSNQADNDNDSLGDACDADGGPVECEEPSGQDTDGDGLDDACDNDIDGDGITNDIDLCEDFTGESSTYSQRTDADDDGIGDACDDDRDGDGLTNAEEQSLRTNSLDADTDGDSICDGDVAVSGCSQGPDACPLDANPAHQDASNCNSDIVDADQDGVLDTNDNCPQTPNTDQANNDADSDGNACDDDDDNDGVPDTSDNCPLTANSDQTDTTANGVGDACSPATQINEDDVDNDGITNLEDNCPFLSNSDQADEDNDGTGDACEADEDENVGEEGEPPGGCSLTSGKSVHTMNSLILLMMLGVPLVVLSSLKNEK